MWGGFLRPLSRRAAVYRLRKFFIFLPAARRTNLVCNRPDRPAYDEPEDQPAEAAFSLGLRLSLVSVGQGFQDFVLLA